MDLKKALALQQRYCVAACKTVNVDNAALRDSEIFANHHVFGTGIGLPQGAVDVEPDDESLT